MTAFVAILQRLATGPAKTCDLIAKLDMPERTVRDALSKLKHRGYVSTQSCKGSRGALYEIAAKGRAFLKTAADRPALRPRKPRAPKLRFGAGLGRVCSVFELGRLLA